MLCDNAAVHLPNLNIPVVKLYDNTDGRTDAHKLKLVISFMSNFLLSKCHSFGIGGVKAVHVLSILDAIIGSQNGTLLTKATNSLWGSGGFLASFLMQTSGVAACPSSNTQPPENKMS